MSYSSPNCDSGDRKQAYYAACLFCYEREYSVLVKSHSIFAWTDDKHQIKIGEPDAPVASAERGRQIIVHSGMLVQAAEDTIEILYYNVKLKDICVYCAASVPPWSDTVNHIVPSLRIVKTNNGFQTPKKLA